MGNTTRSFAILFAFCVGVFASPFAQASPATELRLFKRCYVHLTGFPVPIGDARVPRLKSGATTALKECYALLDNAKLQTNGRPKVDTLESHQVVRQFFNLTRSWLPGTTQEQIQGFSDEHLFGTVDLFDLNSPALAMTYHALKEGAVYSDVLRGTTTYDAIRVLDAEKNARTGLITTNPSRYKMGNNTRFANNLFSFRYSGPKLEANVNFFDFQDAANTIPMPDIYNTVIAVPPISIGELQGIRPSTRNFVAPNFTLDVGIVDLTKERRGDLLPDVQMGRNIYQGFGGGVIGDPAFFMVNSGHSVGTLFNGTFKLPRRWSQTVQNMFLCIDPGQRKPVRIKDAEPYVINLANRTADEAANWARVPAFRQQSSCMQCHSSLDPMASTARNIIIGSSDYGFHNDNPTATGTANGVMNAIFLSKFNPNSSVTLLKDWPSYAAEDDPNTKMPLYARTNPTGTLRYRTSEGQLVQVPVANMEELGNAIAGQDDFYRCTAKRYFFFLTGVDVNLFDRRDPLNEPLNLQMDEIAVERRDLIQKMADELRSTQSIPNMLKVILRSPTYLDINYKQGAQ